MPAHLPRRAVLGALTAGAASAAAPALGGFPLPGQRLIPSAAAAGPDGIIYQTSFETDEPDWLDAPTSYDAETAHTGVRSLRYHRPEGGSTQLASMSFPAEPGIEYELTCYVRATDLDGPASRGAKIGIDSYSATEWLGGSYSVDVRSQAWLKAQLLFTAPEDAERLEVALYLYTDVVAGTAWFDDLTLRVVQPRLLRTELHAPSYRGLLIPGDHDTVALRARIDAEALSGHTLEISLLTNSGTVIGQTTQAAESVLDYTHPAAALEPGRHTLRVALINDQTDETVETEEWGLEKVTSVPTTHFDRHGRFIRDGEPYFPLGLFNAGVSDEALDTISGTPFDTLLPYSPPSKTALDKAAAEGVNVIYPLAEFFYDSTSAYKPAEIVTEADEVPAILDRIGQYGDHPALLAWYVADEPKSLLYERLKVHYDAIVTHDDQHPAYLVDDLIEAPVDFLHLLDVSGTDSYPVYDDTSDIDAPTRAAQGHAATLVNRPTWNVPQAFSWGVFGREGRFPTQPEFRNMTWQFLCEGATGLIYYMLTRLQQQEEPDVTAEVAWDIAVTTAEEVHDLIPVLMSIDPVPAATLPDADWLNVLLKSHAGVGYLLTVNHTRTDRTATFTVPAAMSVSVRGEDRTLPVAPDGSFTDDHAALDVHHYEIELVTTSSLIEQTEDDLTAFGGPGQHGIARTARQLLTKAQAKARVNQQTEAAKHLESYRALIEAQSGHTLSADQVQILVRLSHHLDNGKES